MIRAELVDLILTVISPRAFSEALMLAGGVSVEGVAGAGVNTFSRIVKLPSLGDLSSLARWFLLFGLTSNSGKPKRLVGSFCRYLSSFVLKLRHFYRPIILLVGALHSSIKSIMIYSVEHLSTKAYNYCPRACRASSCEMIL